MGKIIIPAGNIQEGANVLRVWGAESHPGLITRILITGSDEAKILKDAFHHDGTLNGEAGKDQNVRQAVSSGMVTKEIISAMESDSVLSPAEKAVWRKEWVTISAQYTKLVSYADLLVVSSAALTLAKDSLYLFLTEAGVWSSPAVASSLSGSTLSSLSIAYTEEFELLDQACAKKYTEGWSEEGATNDTDIRYESDTTKIDGGKIHADSQITIGNTVDGDYCIINQGDLEFYRFLSGQHRLAKSLKRVEGGVALSGVQESIPGYFAKQPKLIVSPNTAPMYSAAYPGQDQTLQVRADSLIEDPVGSGNWKFNPVCQLILAAGNVSDVVNVAHDYNDITNPPGVFGVATPLSYTSPQLSMPNNTRSVTVNIDWSVRFGTGVYSTVEATWKTNTITATLQFYYSGAWHNVKSVSHYKAGGTASNMLDPNLYTAYQDTLAASALVNITAVRIHYSDTANDWCDSHYLQSTWTDWHATLSTASVLRTGQVNYIAIGE